ncbi:MAG: OsmC family protein [Longimicrobiales bacterium]
MADAPFRLRWDGTGLVFRGGKEGQPEGIVDGDGIAGPSPVITLLIALLGCTAADVVDIARKMRLAIGTLIVDADYERAPEHPRRFTAIRITFRVTGIQTADHDKIRRAVQLSQETYCSVSHSLRPDIALETEIVFE